MMLYNWSIPEIADILHTGFTRFVNEIETEQAVRGIDSLDELPHHTLIHKILKESSFGLYLEQRYPADRKTRKKRSEGKRCDIVLTPDGKPLEEPESLATLFTPKDAISLTDAFWLEIKIVNQFTDMGANQSYSSDLSQPLQNDIRKLTNDPDIKNAALLIVLYTENKLIAQHDLHIWEQRCIEKNVFINVPCLRFVEIGNRIGNAMCTLALYGIN